MPRFVDLVTAELFALRKRSSTWILLGIWALITLSFTYLLPYLFYQSGSNEFGTTIDSLMPHAVLQNVLQSLPFYGGTMVLILGVLTIGSEFGWNTWKTMLTQGPGRGAVFGAKMVALGVALIPGLLIILALSGASSLVVATLEDAAITMPSLADAVTALGAGWMILAVWTGFGAMLAMLTRGTAIAISVGIVWGLIAEGLIGNFATGISWLEWVVNLLFRANGYSLVRPLVDIRTVDAGGPGAFSGPYVDAWQALAVFAAYLVLFVGGAGLVLRRRDVS